MTGVTPIYHIRYPDDGTKLNNLGDELGDMGASIEAALQNASIPPVTNPQIVAASSAAARDAYWGVPATEAARLALQNRGATTVRTDLGNAIEIYLATFNASTNPQGATAAGWYRIAGGTSNGIPTIVEDTGWQKPTSWGSGWGEMLASGWNGVNFRRKNGNVYLAGCAAKSSYAANETMFYLPPGYRPTVRVTGPAYFSTGAYILVETTGAVVATVGGNIQASFGATFPLN